MRTETLDYSYIVGSSRSLQLAALATALLFVAIFIGWLTSKPSNEPSISYMVRVLFASLLLTGILGFSVFCVTYAILNPLLQLEQLLESRSILRAFIINELSTGTLGLRVASFVLAYDSFKAIYRLLFRLPSRPKSYGSTTDFEDPRSQHVRYLLGRMSDGDFGDLYKFYGVPKLDRGAWYTKETITVRLLKQLLIINASQNAVYVMVLANLWFLTINGVDVWQVSLLSWALFYICDDWVIISHYSYALGLVRPWGRKRIDLFNVLLSTLVPLVAVRNLPEILVMASLSMLAIFFIVRYFLTRHIADLFSW